jgi:hypothetical protein
VPPGSRSAIPRAIRRPFANVYKDAAEVIAARIAGTPCDSLALDFLAIEDRARSLAMIESCLESSQTGQCVGAQIDL